MFVVGCGVLDAPNLRFCTLYWDVQEAVPYSPSYGVNCNPMFRRCAMVISKYLQPLLIRAIMTIILHNDSMLCCVIMVIPRFYELIAMIYYYKFNLRHISIDIIIGQKKGVIHLWAYLLFMIRLASIIVISISSTVIFAAIIVDAFHHLQSGIFRLSTNMFLARINNCFL